MIEAAIHTKWYKIEYVSIDHAVFARKGTVEVRAKTASDAVQWFILQKSFGEKKDWYILEVYEREYAKGRTKWKPQINT